MLQVIKEEAHTLQHVPHRLHLVIARRRMIIHMHLCRYGTLSTAVIRPRIDASRRSGVDPV